MTTETIHTSRGDFTVDASWGALRKLWRGYRIAKVNKNTPDMEKYAVRIRNVQRELGIDVAKFPHLGLK